MRSILTTLFIINILVCFGQVKTDDVTYISNNQNFELSPFSKVILYKKATKYNFVIKINRIWWSKYHNERDAKVLGVGEYELNTALVFTKEINNSKCYNYYYPISADFKEKNFKGEINSDLHKEIKLKFYTTIYKTDSNPIIVINCVKLLKN